MATLAGEFKTQPIVGHGHSGNTKTIIGRFNFGTTAVSNGDIRELFYIPEGSLVVGGALHGGDLDSGTETIDIDLGWKANGGASETYTTSYGYTFTNAAASDDDDGFLNNGVLTGDAVTDLFAAGQNYRPIVLPTGPLYFSKQTLVRLKVNAGAATPSDAAVWVMMNVVVL